MAIITSRDTKRCTSQRCPCEDRDRNREEVKDGSYEQPYKCTHYKCTHLILWICASIVACTTEVAGVVGAPPSCKEGCSSVSGTVWVSGMTFGWGPNWTWPPSPVSMGVGSPMFSAAEVLPSGTVWVASRTSPWPGEALRDNTSVSSVVVGGEARGGVSLSTISGAREFPEDDDSWGSSWAGLKHVI